jgi:hypothetical protein
LQSVVPIRNPFPNCDAILIALNRQFADPLCNEQRSGIAVDFLDLQRASPKLVLRQEIAVLQL